MVKIKKKGILTRAVKKHEKKLIIKVLKACNGNQTMTAKKLGLCRTTLISKLKVLGIKK